MGEKIASAIVITFYVSYILCYTGEMDPSGGSVPSGPNLNSGMDPGMSTNI